MNGELDIYTTPHEARQFGQLIRGAEFHTIRNAGPLHRRRAQGRLATDQDALAFLRPQRTQPLNPIYRPRPTAPASPSRNRPQLTATATGPAPLAEKKPAKSTKNPPGLHLPPHLVKGALAAKPSERASYNGIT